MRIAEYFGVTEEIIKNALEYRRIPKRRRLQKTAGSDSVRLQKLLIGETVEVAAPGKFPRRIFYAAARTVGIKISVRRISPVRFRVTRVEPSENPLSDALALIDEKSLTAMYRA